MFAKTRLTVLASAAALLMAPSAFAAESPGKTFSPHDAAMGAMHTAKMETPVPDVLNAKRLIVDEAGRYDISWNITPPSGALTSPEAAKFQVPIAGNADAFKFDPDTFASSFLQGPDTFASPAHDLTAQSDINVGRANQDIFRLSARDEFTGGAPDGIETDQAAAGDGVTGEDATTVAMAGQSPDDLRGAMERQAATNYTRGVRSHDEAIAAQGAGTGEEAEQQQTGISVFS